MKQQGIGTELPSYTKPMLQDRTAPGRILDTYVQAPFLFSPVPSQFSPLTELTQYLVVRGRGEQDREGMGCLSGDQQHKSHEHKDDLNRTPDCHVLGFVAH